MNRILKQGAVFLLVLLFLLGISGCGEQSTPDGGDTDPTATTTAPQEEGPKTALELLTLFGERCEGITACALTEKAVISYEVNGSITFEDTRTADMTLKDNAFLVDCVQTVSEKETAQSLYLTDGRAYIRDGDLRYTLELPAEEVLGDYGILVPKALFSLGEKQLSEVFTVLETEEGYALTFALDKDGINASAAELAELLMGAVNAGSSGAEMIALSVTLSMTKDGDPTGVSYAVAENLLVNDKFITIHAAMDSTVTALNGDVTLTPPEDLSSYDAAETEYGEIIKQLLDENGQLVEGAEGVRDRLSETFGKELVDSVLDMLGLSV